MLFEDQVIEFNELTDPLFTEKSVSVIIARLDKIHPIVSGNKIFKLHYFLQESIRQNRKPVITFGGAYSNHLVATAYACKMAGIKCTGIVRGEKPATASHTIMNCENYGMQLHFISRDVYGKKELTAIPEEIAGKFDESIVIPEGGYHRLGAAGASLIMDKLANCNATHICTAIGTATTLAGLLLKSNATVQITGIPVLKNMHDIEERLVHLGCRHQLSNLDIFDGYHWGGYAKKSPGLIQFMNSFFSTHGIPTDFVYTAKMMYAVIDQIKNGFFAEGSRIVCLHTGGLQGNDSLPAGTLVF